MSRKLALIVATSQHDDPNFDDLKAPFNDAATLAALLRDPQIGGFDSVKISANRKSSDINLEIEKFYKGANQEDLLLFYFSGHGIKDSYGQHYLIARDSNLNSLRATALSSDALRNSLNESHSRKKVIIVDCCFSGAFGSSMTAKSVKSVDLGSSISGEGTILITSSDAFQYSFENDGAKELDSRSSKFTQRLIEGITSGDADIDGNGFIDVEELYEYAYQKMMQQGGEHEQTPQKWTFDFHGKLFLARSPKPKVANPAAKVADNDEIDSNETVRTTEPMAITRYVDRFDDECYDSINEAINASKAGDIVYIRSGTYQENLLIKNPIHLIGESRKSVILTSDEAPLVVSSTRFAHYKDLTIKSKATGAKEPVILLASGSLEVENCEVEAADCSRGIDVVGASLVMSGSRVIGANSLKISGAKVGHFTNAGPGIHLALHANCELSETLVAGHATHGIAAVQYSKLKMTACEVQKNGDFGVAVQSKSEGIFEGNTFFDNRVGGIEVREDSKSEISECEFFRNDQGVRFSDAAEGTVIETTFEENEVGGAFILDGANVKFIKNKFRSNGQGIRVEEATAELSSNEMTKSKLSGLHVARNGRAEVFDNYFFENNEMGIFVYDGGFARMEQNTSSQNGKSGILISEAADVLLKDNTTSSNVLAGIVVSNSVGVSISEHKAFDNGESGIIFRQKSVAKLAGSLSHHNKESGIRISESSTVTANDNRIHDNWMSGLVILGQSKPIFINNLIKDNFEHGIMLKSSGGLFLENQVSGNHYSGVSCEEESSPRFENNEIHESRQYGIRILAGGNGSWLKNDISSNLWAGVAIIDTGAPRFFLNSINSNSTNGVLVFPEAASTALFVDNEVKKNGISPWDIPEKATIKIEGTDINGNISSTLRSKFKRFLFDKFKI